MAKKYHKPSKREKYGYKKDYNPPNEIRSILLKIDMIVMDKNFPKMNLEPMKLKKSEMRIFLKYWFEKKKVSELDVKYAKENLNKGNTSILYEGAKKVWPSNEK